MSETEMPYDERDEESGRFQQSFSDEEFLAAVQVRDHPTTGRVSDMVRCEYRTAYGRLKRLEDEGKVTSLTVGNSLVWRLADDNDRGDEDE